MKINANIVLGLLIFFFGFTNAFVDFKAIRNTEKEWQDLFSELWLQLKNQPAKWLFGWWVRLPNEVPNARNPILRLFWDFVFIILGIMVFLA